MGSAMKRAALPLLLLTFAAPITAQAGLGPVTKAETKKFNKADTNDDEVLSLVEFSAQMKLLTKARNGGPGNAVALQEVATAFFDWFDTDNSNSIDLLEWFIARSSSPTNPTLPSVLTYAGFDPDSDGLVSISEFAKVLKEIIPLKLALAIFKALPEDP
jgi:Ca2+-binding EF-hand superfamily protein